MNDKINNTDNNNDNSEFDNSGLNQDEFAVFKIERTTNNPDGCRQATLDEVIKMCQRVATGELELKPINPDEPSDLNDKIRGIGEYWNDLQN